MTTTTNLGLKKPEINDYVDVSVLNENMDKLDKAIPDMTGNALKEASTKSTPADNDGVVIVDSADSSNIKRILWGKIKALFAPAAHAAQHGVSGSDPVTPAAIGAYSNGIKGAVNCNNISDGAWTISASATNGPGAFACTLFHKDWNADFASQIAFGSDHNVYYRVKTGGSWLAWQEMYSTLRYPSPSKIGAVAKSGDTMTGSLTISHSSYPDLDIKNTGSGSITKIRNTAHRTQIMSQEDDSNYRALTLNDKSVTTDAGSILQIQQIDGGVQTAAYNVLHTGNLSNLGIARIATGSYVGTGTYGSDSPNSLTLPFEPKLLMIAPAAYGIDFEDTNTSTFFYESAIWFAGTTKLSYRDSGSSYVTAYCTFSASGNTISWYSDTANGLARTQLNTAGTKYAYIAIG